MGLFTGSKKSKSSSWTPSSESDRTSMNTSEWRSLFFETGVDVVMVDFIILSSGNAGVGSGCSDFEGRSNGIFCEGALNNFTSLTFGSDGLRTFVAEDCVGNGKNISFKTLVCYRQKLNM